MEVILKGKRREIDFAWITTLSELSGEKIGRCYQCLKCAAGCPVASYMDYTPNQINRLIQYGLKDEVLRSSTIWLCSACETCATRCPNDIAIAKVMDTLKEMAIKEGIPSREREVAIFHEVFLRTIKTFGRQHEVSLIGVLKLKTGQFFKDLIMGLELFRKGKLPVLPVRIKKLKEVKEIFKKTQAK